MVSPFMGFATGALREVRNNIGRWREYEREQEQLQQSRDWEKEKFGWEAKLRHDLLAKQLASSKEIEELKRTAANAKLYRPIGDSDMRFKIGDNPIESYSNMISYIVANPDEFRQNWNDATKVDSIKNTIKSGWILSQLPGNKKYWTDAGTKQGVLPQRIVQSMLLGEHGAPPSLVKFIKDLEESKAANPIDPRKPPPNTVYTDDSQGGRPEHVTLDDKNKEIVHEAIHAINRADFRGQSEAEVALSLNKNFASTYKDITKKYNIRPYDETLAAGVGHNKYYTAVESPFVQYILAPPTEGSSEPDSKQYQLAFKWLREAKNGFLDKDGFINVDDIEKLINLYGYRKASFKQDKYVHRSVRTLLREYQSNKPWAKKMQSMIESKPLIRTALSSIDQLELVLNKLDVGSRSVGKLIGYVDTAKELGEKFIGWISGDSTKLGYEHYQRRIIDQDKATGRPIYNMDAALAKRLSGVHINYQKALAAEYENDKARQAAIAVAMGKVLETTLAYQITSVLQGGVGGRTISDTDVKLALGLFGGEDSLPVRRAKLAILKSILQERHIETELHTRLLKTNANFATKTIVERVGRVVSKINRQAGSGQLTFRGILNRINEEVTNKVKAEVPLQHMPIFDGPTALKKAMNDKISNTSPGWKRYAGLDTSSTSAFAKWAGNTFQGNQKAKRISVRPGIGEDSTSLYAVPLSKVGKYYNTIESVINNHEMAPGNRKERIDRHLENMNDDPLVYFNLVTGQAVQQEIDKEFLYGLIDKNEKLADDRADLPKIFFTPDPLAIPVVSAADLNYWPSDTSVVKEAPTAIKKDPKQVTLSQALRPETSTQGGGRSVWQKMRDNLRKVFGSGPEIQTKVQ